MKLRSLLFVPGDRPDRFVKASASGADAIIIDLEDSVALDRKVAAREATAEYLSGDRPVPVFIRVNPQDSHLTHDDLASVLPFLPDGIVLPKAEGARSVNWLRAEAAAVADNPDGEAPPILPIATETPGAVFDLGTLREVSHWLAGVSWGAEDLPAAVGAATSREADGSYTAPYEMVRSLTLFAAHAAGVSAIDTVFPNISDEAALAAFVARAARDGFTGMLQAVVDAFAANPGAGVLQLDGKMIDAPHLKAALSILSRV
jgi:citrate lyase subunit beta / citryl-CoA lyase